MSQHCDRLMRFGGGAGGDTGDLSWRTNLAAEQLRSSRSALSFASPYAGCGCWQRGSLLTYRISNNSTCFCGIFYFQMFPAEVATFSIKISFHFSTSPPLHPPFPRSVSFSVVAKEPQLILLSGRKLDKLLVLGETVREGVR